ncbi:MAG: ATP-binding protein [Planctomycetes bacterium]|nr:ATP-binding protein [Planctomycetota bacterium]
MTSTIDITPTPRILRTLGDIPFEVWQCVAELADNSLDAFREQARKGTPVEGARVDIHWSKESTPAPKREIIVKDNGPGMSIEQLQNAARAGYSSNDPIHNLGLFGMGFNIATARMGGETIFASATKESTEWVGIKVDFGELVKNQSFSAPIVTLPKTSPDESGTKVIVCQLKDGVFSDIRRKESSIRRRLEVVYAPLIERDSAEIYLQGKKLRAHPHCVWGETRYVIRRGVKIHAVQQIDRDLGEAWFDLQKNRYLSEDEAAELYVKETKGEAITDDVVKRSRRLKGWLGIQRFSDVSDFGVDFVRNGRKILIGDKSLFGFENPDTGSFVPEYPVELGSTVGGRIVGEIHVDYLIPTYQKNGFDTSDLAWHLTKEAIKGAGPILPQKRQLLGYDGGNNSPLGLLANAYRRPTPGTKNLSLSAGISREFKRKYQDGDPDYIPDDKWYRAAQEADKENGAPKSPADPGEAPSDNPDDYGPTDDGEPESPVLSGDEPKTSAVPEPTATTQRDDLIKHSERVEGLCSAYRYTHKTPPMEVTVRKVTGLSIKDSDVRMPFAVFQDGIEIDFFYDETHPLLAEYPITPRQLLLQVLAEKFSLRDPGIEIRHTFMGLVENHLSDERIVTEALKERAQAILSQTFEKLPNLLAPRINKAIEIIKEVESEEESLAESLLEENPDLFQEYQAGSEKAHEALAYISPETLIRLVDKMPEEFMDDKAFTLPYSQIEVGSEEMRKRLRRASVDKILNYLRDIRTLLKGGGTTTKHELIRYSNTLSILEDRLA